VVLLDHQIIVDDRCQNIACKNILIISRNIEFIACGMLRVGCSALLNYGCSQTPRSVETTGFCMSYGMICIWFVCHLISLSQRYLPSDYSRQIMSCLSKGVTSFTMCCFSTASQLQQFVMWLFSFPNTNMGCCSAMGESSHPPRHVKTLSVCLAHFLRGLGISDMWYLSFCFHVTDGNLVMYLPECKYVQWSKFMMS